MAEDKSQKKSDTALKEEEVLKFWQEQKIFEQSLKKPAPQGEFVFYEGPPTANAKPALHHLEARSFKDAIPRYKTMRGFRVRRKAGWDTHGLPVELQVEKELGFTGKPDIEKYGVEAFNKKCRNSVLRYIQEWERFTDRIGYWVDKEDAYYTFDASYMESLWSVVKKIDRDGLLYKDYKVVPWCSRCGTALSSHELAQGYKDVKDLSVTAKFRLLTPEQLGITTPAFFLAWTTTPWTLPGNVALAVGPDIEYAYIRNGEETFIVAKERALALGFSLEEATIVRGTVLGGQHYEPLYRIETVAAHEGKKWQVVPASFVTTTEGTGIVHTAVMYGADDFTLGGEQNLPKVHVVLPSGNYDESVTAFSGHSILDEETTVAIIKDLAQRALLFSKEKYEHSYPFCWRCSTRLIYYARDSWYIRMTDLRDTLISENKKINWEPSHIREGRFGEWLSGVKDWAISRERYWGTPLPLWQSADRKERVVIGSIAELKDRVKKSGNQYFIMRHGEAKSNLEGFYDDGSNRENRLTDQGRSSVQSAAREIKSIDLILVSPVLRAQETAHIVAKELGVSPEDVFTDERLREEYDAQAEVQTMRERLGGFLFEFEQKYSNKRILIISHGYPLLVLTSVAAGAPLPEFPPHHYLKPGETSPMAFVPYPHNDSYELDLHKPYIDQVTLISERGTELSRTSEVIDVWFDSGAMPFAQDHYPFENQAWVEGSGYPADFISEAIDQTRGWFYTLLAIGVLMGRGTPYKNVLCLGHILDEHGAKMSKSKGNVIEPFAAIDEHGADLLRFWMYSVNAPGEVKNFDPKVLGEIKNKVFNPLLNSLQFYELYRQDKELVVHAHILDRWMQGRLQHTVQNMTHALDAYDVFAATRELRECIGDFSLWYVRRSRDRVKDAGADGAAARGMLRFALHSFAKLMAPFAPFVAEQVYQRVRAAGDPISVHLTEWPQSELENTDTDLLNDMSEVRALVSVALEARQKAGIKVRQPLNRLTVNSTQLVGKQDLLNLIQDEVNVKCVVVQQGTDERVVLETSLTPALIEEGEVRDLIREIQDARKEAGLNPKDSAVLFVPEVRRAFVEKHWEALSRATGISRFEIGEFHVGA